MANHIKPTAEELEKQTQDAIAEAEKLANAPVVEEESEPELPEVTPEPITEENTEPEVEPEIENEKVEEQAEPSEEEKEALRKKLEEEKKKSSASARENQKINAKNRIINQALIEADEIPEPTEDEMIKEFGQDAWDVMSETERKLAKETVTSKKWRAKISQAKDQATKIEKWNDSVIDFIENPMTLNQYPNLEGKEEDFKEHAMKPENNNVNFETLVKSFLYDQSVNKVTHKGSMFPSGNGGPNTKPIVKSDKLSIEDARKLRETDYPKWKQMLKDGKISTEI